MNSPGELGTLQVNRREDDPTGTTPRWLLGLAGVVCVVIGVGLVTRPLTSISVLCLYLAVTLTLGGLETLLRTPRRRDRVTQTVAAVSIVVGVLVAVFFQHTVAVLPLVLPIVPVLRGAEYGLLAVARGRAASARVLWGSLAVSLVALGVVGFWWPDVTLIVAGVWFAARTIVVGLRHILRAAWPRLTWMTPPKALPVLRVTASVLVVALAAGAVVGSHLLRARTPMVTAFYSTPASVPDSPGQLIRSERYTTNVPSGVTAWRILYTTTNTDDTPAVASGIVAIPGAPGSGPYPVIAIAHGTIGIARQCAISLGDIAVTETAIPAMSEVFAHGWAVVATDYTGQGAEGKYPYLVGQSEARSTLDAVRAARQLTSLTAQTVVWGHSQGGHAALWASMIAERYAPDVPIAGTAAFAPAGDPYGLARKVLASGSTLTNLVATYVAVSYVAAYPDIDLSRVVNPAATVLVREAAARCTDSPSVIVSVLSMLAVSSDTPVYSIDLDSGALADRLRQNLASGPYEGPVFLAAGTSDEVIPVTSQRQFVTDRCAEGNDIWFREYPGRTHMGILAADSPFLTDLISWTKQAFEGKAPASNCRR